MAQTNYILHIKSQGSNAKYIISYKNGKFYKITHKSGKLVNDIQWKSLMKIVPQFEQNEENYKQIHSLKNIEYKLQTSKKPKTLFSILLDEYFAFYEKTSGLKPRINATEGKALKQIISHLKTICEDDDEVINTWLVMLINWNLLDDFYQEQKELRQINSNINIILRTLKNGNKHNRAKKTANNNADDIKQSL